MIRTTFALLMLAAGAHAQDTRAQILGTVTDGAGARVAGALVGVLNLNSGVEYSALTNQNGEYLVPFVLPGKYTVRVEHPGFKRTERANIEVRVSERIPVNLQLELGTVNETVTVSASTTLLETASASIGQVVDSKRISELPLKDGNPIMLAQLAPGVTNLSTGGWSRPFDVGSPSAIATDGARTGNTEFTMDGAPNNQRSSVAYIPPADVVQEFRILTANFDATQGFSTGAAINVSVKSGTNQLHGTLYHFLQNPALNANRFFSNKAGLDKPIVRMNRWGGSGTGPVIIPKLYDGRNKTFWTYAYEGIHSADPRGTITTAVPLPAQRLGDFSSLLAIGPQYQIYDPATTAPAANGRFSRQPFPNNIIPPSRIDPVAQRIAEFWDEPNLPGRSDGNNNWTTPGPESDQFGSHLFRVDQNFSDAHRVFVRGQLNDRELEYDMRFNQAVGAYFQRRNRGIVFDDVYILNSSMVLNSRYSYNRFIEGTTPVNQDIDLAALGFSDGFVNAIRGAASDGVKFPNIRVNGYGELGNHTKSIRGTDTHEAAFSVNHLVGAHSMRYGYTYRVWRENSRGLGQSSGRLDFGTEWTRGPLDNSPASPLGQGLASFLLGLPTGGFIDRNDSYAMQNMGHALFWQDDWRVNSKLTLSLGIRYELETAPTERYNRSVRDFDFETANPIEQTARANYALNPIPQIVPDAFRSIGGLRFAGSPRALWQSDKNNFMPRFGFAYQLTQNTVLRGGYGIYNELIGTSRQQVIQTGFSTSTALVPSTDNGQTFIANLANPFPQGIATGLGAAGGLSTFVGQDVRFFNPDLFNPYIQRWQMSVQQQLASDLVVELGYVGSRGVNLRTTRELNAVPAQYFSRSPERDQAAIDFQSTNVPNPFYPMLPRTNLSGANVERSQLLRPYPHFTSIRMQDNNGFSWYHGLQTRVEKRLSRDYTVNLSWTWSKFMQAATYLNEFDLFPERVISDQDRTHRVVVSGLWDLPIGRGKRLLSSGASGIVFGGWQVQAIYQYQSGPPLGFNNVIFRRDLKDVPLSSGNRTVERWFNIDAGFERTPARQLDANVVTMPSRFSGIRGDGINNWDISIFKNTPLGETARLQFRTEFINAFNHAQFAPPNTTPTSSAFGAVTAESQWSRTIQFALKLIF